MLTMRRFRSLAISLAILLTIIDLTQGFTIRLRNATETQDLAAEESSLLEVKNDLKRPNNIYTNRKDEHMAILPKQMNTDVTEKSKDKSMTQADREDTERTLVDKVPTEGTESLTTDVVVQTIGGISPKDWFETTMPLEMSDVESDTETSKVANYTSTSPEVVFHGKDEPDNVVLAAELQDISSAPSDRDTTPITTTDEVEKTTEKETTHTDLVAIISDTTETQTSEATTSTDRSKPLRFEAKKYTTIERIRVVNTATDEEPQPTPTERVADSINAHTTESRVSLEQAFDLAPDILSLQQLKNDLMKTTDTVGYRKGLETANSIENQTESIPSTTVSRITEDDTILKASDVGNLIEMVSKRAGYLDHTKTTMPTNATITVNISRDGIIELDALGYEIDPDGFGTGNKTSQSQLAEDAIKEELLKESFINDKEENSMLYNKPGDVTNKSHDIEIPKTIKEIAQGINTEQKVKYDPAVQNVTDNLAGQKVTFNPPEQPVLYNLSELRNSNYTSGKKASYKPSEQTVAYSIFEQKVTTGNTTEDKVTDDLSVKPISPEKKLTNLYTVNPNYKPLKKIDVQPPKPFTRDPDDNSWRNESLSSLGIVFKGKNSSKAFTEVLKNKTEIVMNNLPDQNRTIEKIELRDRLEKIAEKRKSKKKKTDQFGNTEYSDYEENNNSGDLPSSKERPAEIDPLVSPLLSSSMKAPETTSQIITTTMPFVTYPYTFASTEKPKKAFNLQEYYDTSEDDDYVTLPKVDIMKATSKPRVQWPVTQSMVDDMKPTHLFPERKPTLQYFPPRSKPTTEVNINSEYTPPPYSTVTMPQRFTESKSYPSRNEFRNENINYTPNENRNQLPAVQHVQYKPVDVNKNVYFTQAPKLAPEGIPESFNRGFVIRHYKDLIDAAIKDNDYGRNAYLFTQPPMPRGNAEKTPVKSEEYDYDARKEVLDRFVDNFNQNHEQFKVDFPVVFNSSIVHKHEGPEGGKVLASSNAMYKRLYNDATANKANGFLFTNKPYDPNCENITVELSPAYELHYYVPDQEETEEQAAKVTLPYGYRI